MTALTKPICWITHTNSVFTVSCKQLQAIAKSAQILNGHPVTQYCFTQSSHSDLHNAC